MISMRALPLDFFTYYQQVGKVTGFELRVMRLTIPLPPDLRPVAMNRPRVARDRMALMMRLCLLLLLFAPHSRPRNRASLYGLRPR